MEEAASKIIRGRRRHLRAPLRVRMTFTDGNEIRRGFTHNISESGLFIETLDIFPVGTELTVSFALDGQEEVGKVIKASARVVHSNDAPSALAPSVPGMGVYFMTIKNSDRDRIADYVLKTKEVYQRLVTLLESKSPDENEIKKLVAKTPIGECGDLEEVRLRVLQTWRAMEY